MFSSKLCKSISEELLTLRIIMTLDKLEIGCSAKILTVGSSGSLRQNFLEMGMIPGQIIKLTKFAPLGDPMEIQINGYSLTLRKADAAKIDIEVVEHQYEHHSDKIEIENIFVHPGYGEGGKYHNKEHENPLPEDKVLNFALIGNQNSGKTTLFNRLPAYPNAKFVDVPGICSLSTYTIEEVKARQHLLEDKPQAIINIADATNLERNLYLTMQLMELEIPVVLALNMIDELRGNGGSVRINMMEQALGLPVVAISASKNEGIEELVNHAIHIAKYQETPERQDFCDKEEYGGAVHRCLHGIMHLIEDHAKEAKLPIRFAASRIIEQDEEIISMLKLSDNEKEMIEHIIVQMEEERGLDRRAAMAEMRYSFINRLCSKTVVKPQLSKEYLRSQKIDNILTGHFSSIPIFLTIMGLILWLSIDVLGSPLQNLIAKALDNLAQSCDAALKSLNVAAAVRSLVADGIFAGVGTVISFIPIIILLFFFLSILEHSGYLSRVAFMSDKAMRKIGLSGRSIVPLLIGFGCSVPAVMATRTLPSARDRKMTISLIPYISCSAKIPIYAFITSAFFPRHGGLVLISLYLLAIFIGIIIALVNSKIRKRDKVAPFVMELSNYRLPAMKNVLKLIWDKTKDFLQQALTLILLASIVIWFLQSFDFRLNLVEADESILAAIAGFIAPLFEPIGLGDWRIVTSLISGFMAKETVISTLQVLGGGHILTLLTAIPMLVFCLLYTPCIAAISAIKRELGRKQAIYIVIFQCVIAWVCAFVAYLIAGWIL